MVKNWHDITDGMFAETPRHLVGAFTGLRTVADPFRLYAETTITANAADDTPMALFFSNARYRVGCGYHMYFGIYSCQTPEQMFYMTVRI
jgi:hypothetical protein